MRLACSPGSTRRRQRGAQQQCGIALITAIILVAIAAVLATAIGFASAMSARRASTVFGADQSLLAGEGAEAMAAYVLKQSASATMSVSWARSNTVTAAPGGRLPLASAALTART